MGIRTTTRGRRAFSVYELLVVIAVLAVLAAALLPLLAAARRKASRIGCVNCLKQMALASRIWAGDNSDKFPMQVPTAWGGAREWAESGMAYRVFQVMSNELSTPKILICPQDKKHIYTTNFAAGFSDTNISYFCSLDADQSLPNSIIYGDDNFIVHGRQIGPGILNLSTNLTVEWSKERMNDFHGPGNIGLADGSVQQTTSSSLNRVIQQAGMATNRVVIP